MGVNSGPDSVIEGLIYAIDAGNLSSYSGTGTTVIEISRISASTSLQSGVIYYNTSPKGYFQFDGTNDNIPVTLSNITTTTTIEIWMKMKAFVNGMPFGFNNYTIWTGGGGGGTLGFNTAGGDSHGLTSTQVTNLGLLNQWKHYIFEMRSDVSYTNNKIYINGVSQTLSQVGGTEQTANRNFNSGVGRISCWVYDNNYHQTMDIAVFKVYNRALSQSEINKNYNAFRKRFFPEENIVSNGLILNLDLGNYSSYAGTGLTVFNIGGTGFTASIINGATFSHPFKGYLSFDGVDDGMYFTSANTTTNDFTMGVWFRLSAYPGVNAAIIANRNDSDNGWLLDMNGNKGRAIYQNNAGPTYSVQTTNTISLSEWNYLSVTRSGTSLTLYRNGIGQTSTTFPTDFNINSPIANDYVGRYFSGVGFLNGNISNIAYYNRALSSTEHLQNYNALKQRFGLT